MINFGLSHGEAHHHYKSDETKKKYADQLLSLSEKSFLAIMAPGFSPPLSDKSGSFVIFIILGFVFFVGGLYFRHEGLKIYDFLFEKRNPDGEKTEQSRQHGQAKATRLRHAAFVC